MDVQRRDSQATFILFFSPLLFIFKSLGGTLRQPNSSLANIPCTCTCVKESKIKKTSTSKMRWKTTTNDNFLMQVLLARFGSFGIETTVYHGPLLHFFIFIFFSSHTNPFSAFHNPKSNSFLGSSSNVPGHANKNKCFSGLLTKYGFSFKLTEEVVHCLMLLLTEVLQWV